MQALANDRLVFSLFLAAIAHAVLLFAVRFVVPQFESVAQSQDVTLVMLRNETAPDEADFIAQNNRQGSGEGDEKRELTTLTESEFVGQEHRRQQLQSGTPEPVTRSVISVRAVNGRQQAQENDAEVDVGELANDPQTQTANSLLALVSQQVNQYANRPRIETVSSISAMADDDAAYLYGWQQQVERVGNANYPEAARSQRLEGDVRVLVGVNKSGQLAYVEVRKSSGYSVLDNAAKRIVQLAAPFEPLPDSSQADILEIIRTFRFEVDLDVAG